MSRTKQRIQLLLTALAVGLGIPYLIDMGGHALEPQPTTTGLIPINELSASQRLEIACAAVQRMNNKLNRLDSGLPSFLGDLKQYQKVRPELQEVHRVVCGR